MIYFSIFLFYTFISSSVLIYGIGINSIVEIGITKPKDFIYFVKTIITIILSSLFSWLIANYILIPIKLIEIYPLITFFVFIIINAFLESLVRITTGKNSVDFVVSFLIVLLSIGESYSILNTLIICFSCFISLLILIPFCLTFKNRVSNNSSKITESYYSYIFVFFAVLILILSVWDIIWINPGVQK